jgi:hypothetical protein
MDEAANPGQNPPRIKTTNEMDQQPNVGSAPGSTAPLTEEKITRLKNRLEGKLARSHAKARWAGMVEDCEIILSHLDSKGSSSRSHPGGASAGTGR